MLVFPIGVCCIFSNGFVLAGPNVPALVSITDFLLVWPGLVPVLGFSSYPYQGRYARSWFKSGSWFVFCMWSCYGSIYSLFLEAVCF